MPDHPVAPSQTDMNIKQRSMRVGRLLLACVSLVVLAITLASPIVHTARQLFPLAENRLSGWSVYEQALDTPGSGREQISEDINQIIELFKAKHVAAYRLAPELRTNDFIVQRIEEGAWPIPYDEGAAFFVGPGGNP